MNAVAFAVALALGPIRDVRVDHVPCRVSYRSALRPRDVDERARIHVETRDPSAIGRLVRAIAAARPVPDASPADYRYAIRLRDRRGRVRTMYLDAFGTRGEIDGAAVRFGSDAIKRVLIALWHQMSD